MKLCAKHGGKNNPARLTELYDAGILSVIIFPRLRLFEQVTSLYTLPQCFFFLFCIRRVSKTPRIEFWFTRNYQSCYVYSDAFSPTCLPQTLQRRSSGQSISSSIQCLRPDYDKCQLSYCIVASLRSTTVSKMCLGCSESQYFRNETVASHV